MKLIFNTLALAVMCGATQADVLNLVPRQGSMLMPEVYYHADTDSVTVDLSAIVVIAQLTPLMVSNPHDSFASNAPWFDYLDPTRQGLAFSRRYGFDMDVMTDYLPENRALWIRNLGSSPELSFFDYNDFVGTLTWNPILGAQGTSNAVFWNEIMWHIGVAAPPALPGHTNLYCATNEIYVVDTDTGKEVPNSSSGPFVLRWTDISDGRPVLFIGGGSQNNVTLSWTNGAGNWSLVSATNLYATNWDDVPNPVEQVSNQSIVQIESLQPQQFFRLRRGL
jgi:hypothetical protein